MMQEQTTITWVSVSSKGGFVVACPHLHVQHLRHLSCYALTIISFGSEVLCVLGEGLDWLGLDGLGLSWAEEPASLPAVDALISGLEHWRGKAGVSDGLVLS